MLLVLALLVTCAPATSARAQSDLCADLARQVAAENQALDQVKSEAAPLLQMASLNASVAGADLIAAAAQGDIPSLTLDLANTDAARAALVGAEMDAFASGADAQDSASFASDLADHVLDWQGRVASLQPLTPYSDGLAAMFVAMQSLTLISSRGQAAFSLLDSLSQSLAACQAANTNLPPLGCGLTYYGLDRSASPPVLKPAVPGLPVGAKPGDQWDVAFSYPADQGSTVDGVDTYTCTSDGASKVGRAAVQTSADGTTAEWGESNYSGTLWPKTIAPCASWQWHAVQYVGGDQETWNVSVHDAARESLVLPQGKFEAIQLHMEEDIVQADGQTDHVSWDEWYARPQ